MAIYLREVGRHALLTSREERQLGRCVEDGRVLEELATRLEVTATHPVPALLPLDGGRGPGGGARRQTGTGQAEARPAIPRGTRAC